MHIAEGYVHGRAADYTNRELITLIQMARRRTKVQSFRKCHTSERSMTARKLHVEETFTVLPLYTKHQGLR